MGKSFFINLLFYLLKWFLKIRNFKCQMSFLSLSLFLRSTDVKMTTSMLVTDVRVKYVGDMFELLATDLEVFVGNISYYPRLQ